MTSRIKKGIRNLFKQRVLTPFSAGVGVVRVWQAAREILDERK